MYNTRRAAPPASQHPAGRVWLRASVVIAAFLAALPAAGQSGAQAAYSIQRFNNRNGLPINSIKGLEYDSTTGLLWIGTEAGLVAYNGHSFRPIPEVRGRIYVSRARVPGVGDVIYANTDQQQRFYAIRGGHAWLAGTDSSDIFFNTRILSILTRRELADVVEAKRLKYLWPDWIVPLDGQATRAVLCYGDTVIYKAGRQMQTLLTERGDFSILRRIGDYVFLGGHSRLYRLDARTGRLEMPEVRGLPSGPQRSVRVITHTNAPMPLIIYGSGLYTIRPDGDGYQAALLADGLPDDNQIHTAAFIGGGQTIVLGGITDGLYVLRRKQLAQLSLPDSATPQRQNRVVYGQAEPMPGYALTQAGSLIGPDGRWRLFDPPIRTETSLYTDAKGLIWFHKRDTVHCYDPVARRLLPPIVLGDGSFRSEFVETQGQLYAISSFGMYRLQDGHAHAAPWMDRQYTEDRNGLQVYAVAEWSPGVLAVATGRDVLVVNLETSERRAIRVSDNAPVRALWRSGASMFAGTYGEGIFAIRDGVARSIPTDRMGYLRYAHCFLPDSLGYVWISTNNGLFRASAQALNRAAEDPARPVYYHYFGYFDGLENTELNGGCQPCALALRNGRLSFPSVAGPVQVSPGSVVTKAPAGRAFIFRVAADGSFISSARSPRLSGADARSLTFCVDIPYWGNAENLYAWYRIRNYDTGWIPFNAAAQSTFHAQNLPAGEYAFEVRVLSGFEGGQEVVSMFPFTVRYAVYLRWWAWLLYLALLAALVSLVVRRRTYAVRKQNIQLQLLVRQRTAELAHRNVQLQDQLAELRENESLKTRLMTIISHNIISPLRYMHRTASTLAQGSLDANPALQGKTFSAIRDTAGELEHLSINLLNWIRFQHSEQRQSPEAFDPAAALDHTLDLIAPLAREKSLSIRRDTPPGAATVQYKDALQVVAYNLIINAVNYSPEGEVAVGLHPAAGGEAGFVLTVRDQGPGMTRGQQEALLASRPMPSDPLTQQGQGFGYRIVLELVRMCGAVLNIDTAPGEGTEVRVFFPTLLLSDNEK